MFKYCNIYALICIYNTLVPTYINFPCIRYKSEIHKIILNAVKATCTSDLKAVHRGDQITFIQLQLEFDGLFSERNQKEK